MAGASRIIVLSLFACLLMMGFGALAQQKPQGSKLFPEIFDDNWTPPTRPESKPIEPATKPVTPTPVTPPPSVVPPKVPNDVPPVKPPTVAPPTVPMPVPNLLDIPAAEMQANSRQLMREIFAAQLADKSPAGRQKLVQALSAEAEKVRDHPVDRYVLLSAVLQAAREASNLPAVATAADQLASGYKVDALAVKADIAGKMTFKAEAPTATSDNLKAGLALVEALLAEDDFSGASKLVQAMQPAAATTSARTTLTQRAKDIANQKAAFDRATQASLRLQTDPGDPASLFAAGGYLCFFKGNWDAGLPMLSKCGVEQLKAAASADLEVSKTRSFEAVADAWWLLAEREPSGGQTQLAMKQRAAQWYRALLSSGSVTGLARTRIEKRLETLPVDPKQAVWVSKNATYKLSSSFKLASWLPHPNLLNGVGGGHQRNELAFHTDTEDGAHIVIDLATTHVVTGLEIVNRKLEAVAARTKTLTVWTAKEPEGPWIEVWRAQSTAPSWTFTLDSPVSARYVKIGLREKNALALFSVKVFGVGSGGSASQ